MRINKRVLAACVAVLAGTLGVAAIVGQTVNSKDKITISTGNNFAAGGDASISLEKPRPETVVEVPELEQRLDRAEMLMRASTRCDTVDRYGTALIVVGDQTCTATFSIIVDSVDDEMNSFAEDVSRDVSLSFNGLDETQDVLDLVQTFDDPTRSRSSMVFSTQNFNVAAGGPILSHVDISSNFTPVQLPPL